MLNCLCQNLFDQVLVDLDDGCDLGCYGDDYDVEEIEVYDIVEGFVVIGFQKCMLVGFFEYIGFVCL